MSTVKSLYGTSNQSITITLASLGNGSARAGTAIDNTTNLYLDAMVQMKIKTAAASVSAAGYVGIYAYGSSDGGTTYPEANGGADGAVTLVSPTNLRLIGIINCVANATTYTSEPMSVAAAFGGVLPAFWGIVLSNQTGAALDATEGSHAKFYQGIQQQVG